MRRLEDLLNAAPLRAPSRQLAERVDVAFARTKPSAAPFLRVAVPLWACAIVALGCGFLGYVGRGASQPVRSQVVYVLPAEGELRRFLAGEPERRPEDFLKGLGSGSSQPGGKKL